MGGGVSRRLCGEGSIARRGGGLHVGVRCLLDYLLSCAVQATALSARFAIMGVHHFVHLVDVANDSFSESKTQLLESPRFGV